MTAKTAKTAKTAAKAPAAAKARAKSPAKTEKLVKDLAKEVVENLTEEQANALLDSAGSDKDLAEIVKDVKKRKVSSAERDETGKVLRTGKNLSGNQPFRAKLYYFDLDVKETEGYEKAFNAAPNQVRLIMKHMEEEGITTAEDAMRGGEICGEAIAKGKLVTKIEPAPLFAYYRRVMETLGLRLASEG